MRDASTPKRKFTTKIVHVNSFVVLFSYIFLLWQFKILIECFSSNQFDKNMYYFLKIGPNKNVSNFVVYIIKFI